MAAQERVFGCADLRYFRNAHTKQLQFVGAGLAGCARPHMLCSLAWVLCLMVDVPRVTACDLIPRTVKKAKPSCGYM